MTFKLECIDNQFNKSDIYRKRQLIGSIFPKRFLFEKNNVRSTDINPILFKIANINKGLQGNKKRENQKIMISPFWYTRWTYFRIRTSNYSSI